jgi:hypothetical protein
MSHVRNYKCEVCGNERQGGRWFLVLQDYKRNTLKILKWNTAIACRTDVCHVCSQHHAEVLVAHWMATGKLNSPSGQSPTVSYAYSQRQVIEPTDAQGWLRLGELVVSPNSLAGLEKEPSLLMSVLDAIDVALRPVLKDGECDEEEGEDWGSEKRPAFDA